MNTRAKHRVQNGAENRNGHAVVLGGSFAGLLAARVLSDHFERVTLIERDAYPHTPQARKGTPQANHVHGLLVRGRQILEELFPGVQDEMIAAGAPEVDLGKEVAWFTPAGWGVRFASDLNLLSFTRPLLDFHVRRRLALNSRIEILDNTEVLRLLPDSTENHLAGVLICPRTAEADRRVAKELHADLVVDATGRASRTPRWLEELGYQTPKETVVNAHLGYASRFYHVPDDFEADWKCVFIQAAPPEHKRGAIMFTVEDRRWLVTLLGGGRDYPPADEAEFLEFVRGLPVSTIYDAIKSAEPASPIKTHRGTENRLRQFESVKRLPDNLLLLGDAVCAFNPVYGQGMTIAALGAQALQQTLIKQKGDLTGLARRFQKRLAKINQAPWMMATAQDYRYRETVGGSPGVRTKFMHRYMDRVVQLATQSVAVREVLLRTFNMLMPPATLFRPRVLFRVLAQGLKPVRPHAGRATRKRGSKQVLSESRG